MTRIALIVQRFGPDINGGAELHARQWAQALRPHYEVDVLTSCAQDYRQWESHFPQGATEIDGLRVVRFEHPPRYKVHMPLRHKLRYVLRHALNWLGLPRVAMPQGLAEYDGLNYLRGKGPTMDGLMGYLQEHGQGYSALIFFTAFFHPAAMGVLIHPERSLLVPTLHDEKGMYLPHYHRVFRAPRAVLYNTTTEELLARRLYGNDLSPSRVCGVGIDIRQPTTSREDTAPDQFGQVAERLGLAPDMPYLLYVGRVDRSKGCADLFNQFAALRKSQGSGLKLVVCGQWFMPRPDHPDILAAGFVSDQDRDTLIAEARALVVPSQHESLSMVLLESLAAGCPVLVNRRCEVLRQHVLLSGAGQANSGTEEFIRSAQLILAANASTRAEWATLGRGYVAEHYGWAHVVAQLRDAIATCAASVGVLTTQGQAS